MNRIPFGYADAIQAAMDCVPNAILDQLHLDWLCGSDPVWVGFHHFSDAGQYAGRAWAYAEIPHYVDPYNAAVATRPTIVLPYPTHPSLIVHEIGHAVHSLGGWRHFAVPCTKYAHENYWEAYAEAFAAWCGWQTENGQWDAAAADRATVAHLEALACA